MCPLVWWCAPQGYMLSTIVGTVFWITLFCVISMILYPLVEKWVERIPSKIKDEIGPTWFAWHVQSTIHASLVSYMALGPIYHLSTEPARFQLDTPQGDASEAITADIASIANASHVFFCYLLVDTLVTIFRKAMTVDYFLHHVVFCFFCLLIQYDCFAPYLAGYLLIMEISTIFLNGFSFFRNRLGYGHWLVKAFFLLFGISFLFCRLVGTTYIAAYFCREVLGQHVPWRGIPRWHLWLLCVALVAAVAIQIFWAWAITKKLVKVMRSPSAEAGDGASSGDNGERSATETLRRPLVDG